METTPTDGPAQAARLPPLRVDVSYALVTLGSTAIWSVLSGWLLYFYLPPEGEGMARVPAALLSGVLLATRVLNALIAPPIGQLSDHTRSRWGRRLPYMALSALPMLALFVLVWTPPVYGESLWNLLYLAVVFTLYNGLHTLNQVPYTALLPEIAVTDAHRVRISAWTSAFLLLGMILSALAGPLIARIGYAWTGLFYAVVCLPLFYLPLFVLRERRERQIPPEERLTLWQGFAAMARNRPFWILTVAGGLYWVTTTLVQSALPFIVTEICGLDTADTLYFYLPSILGALACYPLVAWLAGRVGKWRVFTASLLASAAILPGVALIGRWLPLSLTAQGILWVTLQAIAMSGAMMLPPAFGAEITDYDAALTGQRREGLYYATWGLLDQVGSGAAAALLPLLLLLGRSRFDPHGPLGVRMVGIVSSLLMLVAFLVFLRYPLRPGAARKGE
jgi:GPH family glycoside/pentoside/hexuronide:cation symporter